MLQKDETEHSIPEPWRTIFRQIADAFAAGDFALRHHRIAGVEPVDPSTAQHIADKIAAYGGGLAPLSDATWKQSVYRWIDGHWLMLVDLSTVAEPVSDLTLHAKLHEADDLRLEINSVHVP
ncbi:MAG: hypothetical protein M3R03_08550 [Pseudomonadota bacterium]|nr:hypothetical protein [Pseudomonadota bacterium]